MLSAAAIPWLLLLLPQTQTCEECRPRLRHMCGKQLPCRHWCCGVHGGGSSSSCLPCLQEGCELRSAAVGNGLCCFCFEPLISAPVMQLSCAGPHFVHLECVERRLKVCVFRVCSCWGVGRGCSCLLVSAAATSTLPNGGCYCNRYSVHSTLLANVHCGALRMCMHRRAALDQR